MSAPRRVPKPAFWLFSPLIAVLVMRGPSAPTLPVYAAEYDRDFAKQGFDNRALTPVGAGATSLIRQSEEGVRITIPRGAQSQSVGVAPRFVIRGDFEITLWYEIRTWDRPKNGSGNGPTLYVTTGGNPSSAAEIGRVYLPDGKHMHTTFARTVIEEEQRKDRQHFEAGTMRGQLRLLRTGSTLEFAIREDWQDEPFHLLHSVNFNTADLSLVRLAIKRSDLDAGADVLFGRLRIRADDFPEFPSNVPSSKPLYQPAYHPPPQATSWTRLLFLGAGILGILMIGALLFWRWVR